MPLSDTGKAIGAVTKLLRDQLQNRLIGSNLDVTIGRTEPPTTGALRNPRLNLFLYETHFDEYMKNISLYEGQQPPLWLVLRYLLTAFDSSGESDTVEAHEHLGEGIRYLQGLNFLSLRNSLNPALNDNPEDLKITFIESSYEFLGKIMQGSEEKYRLSVSFEVRPIMIASAEPPTNSLLVGIDYTKKPFEIIDKKGIGIGIEVFPFLGPSIISISPAKFEVNSTLTIFGNNLDSDITVTMGLTELQIISQRPDKIECLIPGNIEDKKMISAGSQSICVVQNLKNSRKRSSNLLVGELLPTLTTATIITSSITPVNVPQTPIKLYANIDLVGVLLGQDSTDDVYIGLYQKGNIVKIIDTFSVIIASTKLKFEMKEKDAVLPGKYRIILIVHGQQAKNSPELEFVIP